MKRTAQLKLTYRKGRGDPYRKTNAELFDEVVKKYAVSSLYERMNVRLAIENAMRQWTSAQGDTISVEWYK